MNKLLCALIFTLLSVGTLAALPDNFTRQTKDANLTNLTTDIINLGYSPDHELLIVLQEKSFAIYDGKSLKFIGLRLVKNKKDQPESPYCFAFD